MPSPSFPVSLPSRWWRQRRTRRSAIRRGETREAGTVSGGVGDLHTDMPPAEWNACRRPDFELEPAMTSSSRRSGIKLHRPFVGIPSFLRARIETGLDSLDADITVYGVPFDESSPFLAGSRMGPRSIREHSLRFASPEAGFYDPETGRTYLAHLPRTRDGEQNHRRCRRMAHRRDEHVRQCDRLHEGSPCQGGNAGSARW